MARGRKKKTEEESIVIEEKELRLGFWCPRCKTQRSHVHTTIKKENQIIRYRKCVNCNHNFSTTEQR